MGLVLCVMWFVCECGERVFCDDSLFKTCDFSVKNILKWEVRRQKNEEYIFEFTVGFHV